MQENRTPVQLKRDAPRCRRPQIRSVGIEIFNIKFRWNFCFECEHPALKRNVNGSAEPQSSGKIVEVDNFLFQDHVRDRVHFPTNDWNLSSAADVKHYLSFHLRQNGGIQMKAFFTGHDST
uniref:Uncharacterized protein n=1 Tax=Hyaloperonospora arabidopsidis (strain Emoy2) TaxID=559515 RepID=M4BAV5_HYAAE